MTDLLDKYAPEGFENFMADHMNEDMVVEAWPLFQTILRGPSAARNELVDFVRSDQMDSFGVVMESDIAGLFIADLADSDAKSATAMVDEVGLPYLTTQTAGVGLSYIGSPDYAKGKIEEAAAHPAYLLSQTNFDSIKDAFMGTRCAGHALRMIAEKDPDYVEGLVKTYEERFMNTNGAALAIVALTKHARYEFVAQMISANPEAFFRTSGAGTVMLAMTKPGLAENRHLVDLAAEHADEFTQTPQAGSFIQSIKSITWLDKDERAEIERALTPMS